MVLDSIYIRLVIKKMEKVTITTKEKKHTKRNLLLLFYSFPSKATLKKYTKIESFLKVSKFKLPYLGSGWLYKH